MLKSTKSASCITVRLPIIARRGPAEAVVDEFGQHCRFLQESALVYRWFLTAQAHS